MAVEHLLVRDVVILGNVTMSDSVDNIFFIRVQTSQDVQ